MVEALQFEFMRNALLAGMLASVICGVIGSLVVVHRIVFISGGIAHAAYGGIGLALFLGWPLMPTTIGFALAVACLMAAVTLKIKHRADTVIGVIWALGMAVGVVLVDLTPGYNVNLMSYLFGSILAVGHADLWMMLAIASGLIAAMALFYHPYLAMSYDEEFARIRGIPVTALYFLLISMLAVSIVMVIQVVGLILVIALLTIAPFTMEKRSKSLFTMMAGSVGLNLAFTIAGLWVSYAFNLTSGACIILVAGGVFLVASLLEGVSRGARRKTGAAVSGPGALKGR